MSEAIGDTGYSRHIFFDGKNVIWSKRSILEEKDEIEIYSYDVATGKKTLLTKKPYVINKETSLWGTTTEVNYRGLKPAASLAGFSDR